MTLLRQIQDAAVSDDTRVADLLRKCKILASRLKSAELSQWVGRELDGYPDKDELPDYRILHQAGVKGHFSGPFGSGIRDADIPLSLLPKPLRDKYAPLPLRGGVAMYEDLLSHKDQGEFNLPIPPEIVQFFAQNVYPGYNCLQAWVVIPRGALVGVLDAVKNKILGFALDIEQENPAAGEADADTTPVPQSTVSTVFNQHFHGSVGNVAAGSQDFQQNATVNQQWQQASLSIDLPRLAAELPELRTVLVERATEPEHYEAISAVRSAEIEAQKQDGPKALQYLAKAGQWAADAAKEIGSTVAVEAIKQAIGISNTA